VDPVGPSDGKDIRKTVIADGIYQFTTSRDATRFRNRVKEFVKLAVSEARDGTELPQ
jgi:hypothetical protein